MKLPTGLARNAARQAHAHAGVRPGESLVHVGHQQVGQWLARRWSRALFIHVPFPGDEPVKGVENVEAHPFAPPMLEESQAALILSLPDAADEDDVLDLVDTWMELLCPGGRVVLLVPSTMREAVEGLLHEGGVKCNHRVVGRAAGPPPLVLELIHGTVPWDWDEGWEPEDDEVPGHEEE